MELRDLVIGCADTRTTIQQLHHSILRAWEVVVVRHPNLNGGLGVCGSLSQYTPSSMLKSKKEDFEA